MFDASFYLQNDDMLLGYCYLFAAVYSNPNAFSTTYNYQASTFSFNTTALNMNDLDTNQEKYTQFYMWNISKAVLNDKNDIIKVVLPQTPNGGKNSYVWYEDSDFNDIRPEERLFAHCPADSAEFPLGSTIKLYRKNLKD